MTNAIIGGIAELRVTNDVAAELELRPAAIQTLGLLADRGGEIPWDWDAVKLATREMIADMIEIGLVVEREYVTHATQVSGRLALRMTDKGRNVIELHRKRRVVVGAVKPIEVEAP